MQFDETQVPDPELFQKLFQGASIRRNQVGVKG
jgi:hypothetical protein